MIKRIVKKIKSVIYKRKFQHQSTQDVFTTIYDSNYWGDSESVSGEGSNLEQTQHLELSLSQLFRELEIKSVLDIPCGDFYWMSKIDLSSIDYIGADIVEEIISNVSEKYTLPNRKFKVLDLIKDDLPKVDLIFVRDCLVHLSDENISQAIQNIKRSGSKYLLTTSFVDQSSNKDIITGDWRPINLELKPYNFSKPTVVINEKSSESGGKYSDKSLLLWPITELPES